MSQNWDESGWWNKPQGNQGQGTAATQQGPPQEAERQPSPIEIVQQVARDTYAQSAQEYADYAAKRKSDYEAVNAKFLGDKDLAPFYPLARDYFAERDNATQQRAPVAQLYDETVRHVQRMRALGVKPPTPPAGLAGGGSSNYDVPLQDQQQGGNRGFRTEDPSKVREAQFKYLRDRQLDLDRRKYRGAQDDLDKLEELREQQYQNQVTFDKVS